MNTKQDFLNKIRIATPCSADWDKMTGDERVRHCQQCKLDVFNIAEMTRDEAYQLIQNKSGRLCVQLYRRQDGTVITKDCPVGLERVKRAYRHCAASVMALFAWIGLSTPALAQDKNQTPLRGDVAIPTPIKCKMGRTRVDKPEIKRTAGMPAPMPVDGLPIPEAGRIIPTRGSVAIYPDKGEIQTVEDVNITNPETTIKTRRNITPLKKENHDKNRLLAGGLILAVLGSAMKLIFGSMKKRSGLWIVGSCSISAFVVIGLIWQTFW